jgi:hypothetical protein
MTKRVSNLNYGKKIPNRRRGRKFGEFEKISTCINMNSTWLIIGVIIFVISLVLAIWGGYEKYKVKNPSSTYKAMFWGGVAAGGLSIGLIIIGAVMKPPMASVY